MGHTVTHIGSYIIQVVIVIQPASVSSLTGLFSKDVQYLSSRQYSYTGAPLTLAAQELSTY